MRMRPELRQAVRPVPRSNVSVMWRRLGWYGFLVGIVLLFWCWGCREAARVDRMF